MIKAWKLQIHVWNAKIGESESVTTGNDVTKEVEEQNGTSHEQQAEMERVNCYSNVAREIAAKISGFKVMIFTLRFGLVSGCIIGCALLLFLMWLGFKTREKCD